MKINENKITLVNGKKTVVYDILFSFEANNNKYYVYTNNEEDEDGFIKVYAGIYMKDSKKEYLIPVESEEELSLIEGLLAKLDKNGDIKDEKNNS
jgi:uncharacterized protein YrzB (UPF0473 family)